MSGPTRATNLCLIVALGLSILAPLGAMVFWPSGSSLPTVPAVAMPRRLNAAFPDRFQRYFDTHIGWRRHLVGLYNAFEYLVAGTSATPGVVVGRGGWLFLDQERMRESITASDLFTPAALDAWVQAMAACQQRMAAWGGKVLLVIAPNKATIYPDRLPRSLRLADGPRRIDQLTARLEAADLAVLDLRPVIRDAAVKTAVFGKLDTHWNGFATQAAARHIAAAAGRLSGKPTPFADEDVQIHWMEQQGDLARMLLLPRGFKESRPIAVMTSDDRLKELSHRFNRVDLDPEEKHIWVFSGREEGAPRVVFHRDSFSRVLMPLLVNSFSRSVWLWRREFDRAVIDAERPDVVVVQVAERYLEGPPLQNPF